MDILVLIDINPKIPQKDPFDSFLKLKIDKEFVKKILVT
jgi:hypothetical protein